MQSAAVHGCTPSGFYRKGLPTRAEEGSQTTGVLYCDDTLGLGPNTILTIPESASIFHLKMLQILFSYTLPAKKLRVPTGLAEIREIA